MRMKWLLLAFCLFMALSVGMIAAVARDTASAGGSGGGAFRDDCGDRYLIGVRIWQGDSLDGIMPICGELDAKYRRVNGFQFPGGHHGGYGGSEKTVICPGPSVVRGFKITIGEGDMVGNVHLLCKNTHTGEWTEQGTGWTPETSGFLGGFTGGAVQHEGAPYNCRENEDGHGIFGRAGNMVDRLGLICKPRPAPAAAPPPPPAPPPIVGNSATIREVGKTRKCAAYADQAVGQNELAQARNCGFGPGRHAATRDGHYQWCMGATDAAIESERNARLADIQACQFCNDYADASVTQIEQGRSCPKASSAIWSPTPRDGHFAFCMQRGATTTVNPLARQHFDMRASILEKSCPIPQ